MKTEKLVKKMLSESKEVKFSVGGTKEFRNVMDFVLTNERYQDQDLMKEVIRKPKEITKMVESTFSKNTLKKVKSIYK